MGFSRREKLHIISEIRSLHRARRSRGLKLSVQDIEQLIWDLESSRLERFFNWFNELMTCVQGNKKVESK